MRGLFEYAVICGDRADNPVPTGPHSSGMRATRGGLLGHADGADSGEGGGWCASLARCPRASSPALLLSDLETHRDRAVALLKVPAVLFMEWVRLPWSDGPGVPLTGL
ncbi:MAG: hypothetical protein M3P85_11255 [Actinomycetota bacterium]|nr:hypothetical protein [Actinomycetota bacterium]